MAFPNSNYTDILATTIERRGAKLADNITNDSALLTRLKKRGNMRTFSGGHKLIEPLIFAENGNKGYYTGGEVLPTAPQDVISASEYSIKQAAVPVSITGLEQLQNNGPEAVIDLLAGRIQAAEATMANLISTSLYSDGTAHGGKEFVGLKAHLAKTVTSGTVGNIDRAVWTFWRNYTKDTGADPSSTTIRGYLDEMWANTKRGNDQLDLIVLDDLAWAALNAALQGLQEFRDPDLAQAGFLTIKYLSADVLLDNDAMTKSAFGINSKYLFFKTHADRNFVALKAREPYNQDVSVTHLLWAGAMTASNCRQQGYIEFAA